MSRSSKWHLRVGPLDLRLGIHVIHLSDAPPDLDPATPKIIGGELLPASQLAIGPVGTGKNEICESASGID